MKINEDNVLLKFFKELQAVGRLKERIQSLELPNNVLRTSQFTGSSKTLMASFLSSIEKQVVVLLPDRKEVQEVSVELDVLGTRSKLISFESYDKETIQKNLTSITDNDNFIVVATYELLRLVLPPKEDVKSKITKIEAGGEISYDELLEYLGLIEYQRDNYVDLPGTFAIRGSIIDFWSYSEKYPVRVEFDGDFLESIRTFDPESQRSTGKIEIVTLASQIQIDENHSAGIFDYLDNPIVFADNTQLNDLFTEKTPEPVKVKIVDVIDDDLKKELYDDSELVADPVVKEEEIALDNRYASAENFFKENSRWIVEHIFTTDNRIELGLIDAPAINSSFEILFNQLQFYVEKGYNVFLTTENDIQGKRLADLLSEFKKELAKYIEERKIKIFVLPIKSGFIHRGEKILVLTDYQIFNKPYRTKIIKSKKFKKSRAKDLAAIKRGDFVVHEDFGIGRYLGLETINIGQVEQECIKVQYAEGGLVYVNLNYLSLVKKFSSKDNVAPTLSTLGSGEWKKTKKKVKGKIKEAARELIKLYAARKSSPGFAFSTDSVWQKELEASFFYEDTPDQARVTEEVKSDMEMVSPMDRLVCGDVGFGKTEIAVRAAFKAVSDGKQVGVLVPTTILAEQHYNTFKDRLSQFPVKVDALSRFQKKSQQTEIVMELEKGNVDVVIGTHRLLSKDIKFKDLGLLIIDEEHRFGVMAKEKLRSLRASVDTLTLTATPIPRTLNMSLLGARDLSIIATPPPNRMPIYTKVDVFDVQKVREWILEEIKRGGQLYFVHDRVQSIEKIGAYLQKHIPEITFGIAHGQMKPTQLENIIHDFLNKKFHILISTKIIESGIDIPNVNTIIINRADRFGLAELHQLRGRVGRSDRQAYAYLLVPSMNTITKKAVKRLQAIEEYTDLGEGFNLSMRDLEIRGAGNLLGTEQSGVIDSVGFDLYVKLLDEAVEELKRNEFQAEFKDLPKQINRSEPTIDAYFEIGIPESFMPEQSDRLSYYTAMFSVIKEAEIDEVKEELIDRFGKLPNIIERLVLIAKLRYHVSTALFERIVIKRDSILIILPKSDNEEFYKNKFVLMMQFIQENHSKTVQFKQTKDIMKLELRNNENSVERSIQLAIDFCKSIYRNVIDLG